jgi:protein arginine kinase activator
MKCDTCNQEATVHELRVVGGKKVERHLCEKCARDKGVAVQPSFSVELIEKNLQHASEGKTAPAAHPPGPAPAKATSCPACGTTYVEFRQTGLLGCSECYKAFEAQLGPLLERAHEGGTHHVGKLPARALTGARARIAPGGPDPAAILGDAALRAGRLSALRKQLDDAVRAEQYERAATLRDELRRMTELESSPSLEGQVPPENA